MPKYYRVNLKDKENNIIYPNIHNNWTFDKDGNVNINSNITLGNNNFIKLSFSQDDRKLMLNQCNVNYIVPNGGWAMGIDYRTQSNTTFGAIGCVGEKETIKYFYIGANYNNPFFKVDNLGNASIKGTFAVNGTALKTNGNFFLDGTASGILNTTTKIIFSTGDRKNIHAVITANSSGEIAFLNSLNEDTFKQKMIAYKPQISAFVCQTNEAFNLGTSDDRWGSLYARDGYFRSYVYSGDYAGFGVDRNYYFMLGGQDSYTWIDLRRKSDGAVVNNLLFYPDKLTTNKMQGWKSICIPKNGTQGYGLCNADDKSIIRDHNNKNVTVDATGGTLCLAYENTVGIDILKGKVKINSSGEITAPKFHGIADSLSTLRNSSVINLGNCGSSGDYVKIATMVRNTSSGGNGSFIFIITGTNAYGGLPNAVICELTPRVDGGYYMSMFGHASDNLHLGIVYGNGVKDVWLRRLSFCSYNRIYILDSQGVSSIGKLAQQSNAPSNVSWITSKYPITGTQGKANVKNLNAGTVGTWNSEYSGYENGTVMFCW